MGSSAGTVRGGTGVAEASTRTPGQEAFRDLESWLCSDTCQRLGLLAIEREIEFRGQEVHRLLLQEHIDRRGSGDISAALRVGCPDGGTVLHTHKRVHVWSLITLFGEVSIARIHRKAIRTTNVIERAFEELRRRTKVIPRFFTERSCLKLAFAELVRVGQRARRVRMSEIELRQLQLLRSELHEGRRAATPRRTSSDSSRVA